MANANMIKFYRGLVGNLPTNGENGALYITTDEGAIYYGTGSGMKRLGDFVQVDAIANLPTEGANTSALYYCVAENVLAKWNGEGWTQVNKQPTADEMKTLLGLGDLAYLSEVAEANLSTALREKVNAAAEGNHAHLNKDELDKVADGDVEKWNTAYAHSQAAHAPANAQENVIESVKVNGEDLEIKDKVVDIIIPESTKVEASEINGNIKVDGEEVVVYTHAEKHTIAEVDGLGDALAGKQDVIPENTYDAYGASAQALVDAKAYSDASDIFQNDTALVNAHGGLKVGEKVNGMTTHQILEAILFPYVAFTLDSTSRSAAATTLENGATQNLTSASITITKKSKPITSVTLYNGSSVLGTKTGDDVAAGGTIKFENLGITVSKSNNPNLKFTVTDGTTSTDKNVGASTFVYPYYWGVCAADATIDEALVESLTKKVETKANKTVTYTCANERMVFAYPKVSGYTALKSVIDPNNFEIIDGFTCHDVSITGLDGTAVTYYVYVSTAGTSTNFKVQFKY